MNLYRKIGLSLLLTIFSCQSNAQGFIKFPSLSEARNGFIKQFKIPSLKDYQKFSSDYQKHLSLLNRRSEKAYRKSFLKFIQIEDQLLYSLCDSNEFRANALMRSSMASYGKLERDRQRYGTSKQKFNYQEKSLRAVADVSHQLVPGLDPADLDKSKKEKKKTTERFGSQLYADYMQKRVFLYNKTFEEGSKKQKKLYRKLKRKAQIWGEFKAQDSDLIADFAKENTGIMRMMKATPEYGKSMKASLPDYSGTQLDKSIDPSSLDVNSLLQSFKESLSAQGLLSDEQIEKAGSISQLFKNIKEAKDSLPDSLQVDIPKEEKINKTLAKTFWDRLYGGVDFNWQNSTGYYPDGLGLTLTGGYELTDNSGLNIELSTLFNGSEMGFSEDLRFDSKLISNYTLGAILDHKIWKIIYGGLGANVIANTLEAPATQLYNDLQNIDYTLGIPVVLKVLVPVTGMGKTNIEFRYDLNSKNNIKPAFNFKVGYLIGR